MNAPDEHLASVTGISFHSRSLGSIEHDLETNLRQGLLPVGLLAALSVYSCLILLAFIATRIYSEWKRRGSTLGHNQYIMLVFNLLIADLMQSIGFIITWHWYLVNDIVSQSAACFAQGWMIHSGDLSSGFFVLIIAMHTYYTAVYDGRLGHGVFTIIVSAVWTLTFLLTVIGVGLHTDRYFERAGAWCWVAAKFDDDRLWLHYFWVFLVQFGTITLYLLTFIMLRRRTRQFSPSGLDQANNPNAATAKKVNRVAILMTLYPCCYIILTLPLSVGRMWSMAHGRNTSIMFSCIAGSLMTSCGWVDCLLYTLTRRRLLQDTMPYGSGQGSTQHQSHHQRSASVLVTRTTDLRTEPADPEVMAPAHHQHRSHGLQSLGSSYPHHACHNSTDPIPSNQMTQSSIKTTVSGGRRRQSWSYGFDEEHELHTWEKFLEDARTGHPW